MSHPPVTFFYPYPDELARIDQLDLHEWEFWSHEGKERRRAWVLQTYLWLREFDYEVAISATLPRHGILVLLPEPEIKEAFFEQYSSLYDHLLICTIRADITGFRSPLGDAEVLQNGKFADDERAFFVPHWTQPGLIPRDPSRGNTIENIVFKGGYGSLHADYRSDEWLGFLDKRGLTFEIASAATESAIPSWHDYSYADLNLAVRPDFNDGGMRCEKPASKLVNAWLAGVPSILGPEYAYRELRKNPLDYIEVQSLQESMAQIDRLLENKALYQQIIEQCNRRAEEFTKERIARRWAEVLLERVPEIYAKSSFQWSRRVPLKMRQAFNVIAMPPTPFEFRKQVGHVVRGARTALNV